MEKDKCIDCLEYKRCKDSYTSWIFFIIGLIATIALRIVIVLMHLNPVYGKAAWYIGVGGFFIFFLYKYRISQSRSSLISRLGIVDRLNAREQLTEEDYGIIGLILCSLSSKKERINYFFIFGLSAVALIIALYIDIFK